MLIWAESSFLQSSDVLKSSGGGLSGRLFQKFYRLAKRFLSLSANLEKEIKRLNKTLYYHWDRQTGVDTLLREFIHEILRESQSPNPANLPILCC